MAKSFPVMTRLEPETKKKLRALAENTQRSESFIAREAIEAYIAENGWQVALIKDRLEEAKRPGHKSIPHEDMVKWARRWLPKKKRASKSKS